MSIKKQQELNYPTAYILLTSKKIPAKRHLILLTSARKKPIEYAGCDIRFRVDEEENKLIVYDIVKRDAQFLRIK